MSFLDRRREGCRHHCIPVDAEAPLLSFQVVCYKHKVDLVSSRGCIGRLGCGRSKRAGRRNGQEVFDGFILEHSCLHVFELIGDYHTTTAFCRRTAPAFRFLLNQKRGRFPPRRPGSSRIGRCRTGSKRAARPLRCRHLAGGTGRQQFPQRWWACRRSIPVAG